MKNLLHNDLIDSFNKESLVELSTDIAELLIDSKINSDLIKDIPVIGSLVKLFKSGASIRDYLFLKKLSIFLFELSKISIHKRNSFLLKAENDRSFKQKIGEKLLILLEKFDDNDKSILLANALKALIEEKITYKTFVILSQSIEKFSLVYAEDFIKFYAFSSKEFQREVCEHFFNCGLLSININREISHWGIFRKNEIGGLFFDLVCEKKGFDVRKILLDAIENFPVIEQAVEINKNCYSIEIIKNTYINEIEKLNNNDIKEIFLNANSIIIPKFGTLFKGFSNRFFITKYYKHL